ncbi:pimeloyl-ACP methyl ester carboxylesterase [Streptomyces phaeochromogenes]|jgi:pimeloyl-ACP methyl ester carboxylesterase|uniref:alpha/beta fold hydrolase n=1 Tax=Streptomyces phaeochromogenes TaxID=1923 RepID=UPI00278E3756|nr:alpha/beta hydrolase [Streptomyces phaeochromogenes]MDQ0947570.1 pimeloyl-ACP methyl ester carboxylesterase [Streptomyces phaeochromogenes]
MTSERHPRRRVLGGMLAAGTGALGLGGALPSASAAGGRPAAGGAKPTVVLVHGVFADASGWYKTMAGLQDAGFPVIAAANPPPDSVRGDPQRTLAGDSAYVSSIVDTIPGPVILVGHSYGGEVITNAGRGHTNVKALVYVAAFAPDEGESALQLAEQFPGSQLPGALVTRPFPLPVDAPAGDPGLDGYIDPAKFREVFAGDLPRSETRLMAAAQRPGSVGGLAGRSGAPAWKSLPSWYVIPTADKVIPPAVQRFMAQRAGSRVVEVKGASHVVMMSRPAVVVRQILAAHLATR